MRGKAIAVACGLATVVTACTSAPASLGDAVKGTWTCDQTVNKGDWNTTYSVKVGDGVWTVLDKEGREYDHGTWILSTAGVRVEGVYVSDESNFVNSETEYPLKTARVGMWHGGQIVIVPGDRSVEVQFSSDGKVYDNTCSKS